MGTKALIRLVIILAVVGIVAVILHFVGTGGSVSEIKSSTDKKKVFSDFPINDVARITVQAPEQTVTIQKGKDRWEVVEREGYAAKAENVATLLRKIWDLPIVQPVVAGPSQFDRLKLLAPGSDSKEETATILKFENSMEKELATLWLGKVYERSENRPNPFGGGMATSEVGRYIKRGDKNNVYLVGETFESVKEDPAEWLDDSFFKVEKIKSIAIKAGDGKEDWKLVREDNAGDFTLAGKKDDETLDTTKTASMKSAFANPRFEDVLVGKKAEENKPDDTTFVITTFDGFTYEISVGEKNDLNELPLSVKVSGKFEEKRKEGEEESDEEKERLDKSFAEDLKKLKDRLASEKKLEGHTYLVRSYLVDSINKKRSELLKVEEEADKDKKGTPKPPGITLPGIGKGGKK